MSNEGGGSDNRLWYLGIGVVGVGLAVGIAGWYLLNTGNRPSKGRRKKPSKTPKGGVSLEEAGKLSPHELMKALEQAQSTNDYASQINILYMLGTHRAKDGSKQGAEEALEVYNQAFRLAKMSGSEMEGPVEVEIALLNFSLGNQNEAMDRFESGLRKYLIDPQRAKNLNPKILLQFFLMLNECYYNLKAFQRGIDYLLDYMSRLNTVGAGQGMFPNLILSVGEMCFLSAQYEACVEHLEGSAGIVNELSPDMRWLYYNYLGWAYVRQKKFKEALPILLKFVEVAKTIEVPEGTVLDSLEQISAIHDILGDKDAAVAAFKLALAEVRKINLQEKPILGIKHYYFLGIFSVNRLGDPVQAKELLETAYIVAKRMPDFPWHSVAVDLSDVKYVMKDRDGAAAQLNALLQETNVDDEITIKVLYKLARIHSEMANKSKALEIYERLVEKVRTSEKSVLPEPLVAHRVGKLYLLTGNLSKASHFLKLAQSDETDPELKSQVGVALTAVKAQAGERQEALKGVEELVLITENSITKDTVPIGELKTDLGEILLILGEYNRATEEFQKALAACGPEQTSSAFLCNLRLSSLLVGHGQKEKAYEYLLAAQKTAEEDKAKSLLGAVEIAIANYWYQAGNLSKALDHAKTCLGFLDPACLGSSPLSLTSYHLLFAECSLWAGNVTDALASLSLLREHVSPSSTSLVKESVLNCLDSSIRLASLYLLHGDINAATEIIEVAFPVAKEKGSKRAVAEAHVLLALLKSKQGHSDQEALLTEGLSTELADKRVEGRLQLWAGIFYSTDSSNQEKAQSHFDKALQLSREAGDKLTEALVLGHSALLTGSESARTEALRFAKELDAKLVVTLLNEVNT